MDDKMFELLEKLYIKVTNIETDVKTVKSDVGGLKEEVVKVRQDVAKLESELKGETSLLTDGYKQTYEILNEVRTDIKELKQKVEKQELEITVIKKAI